MSFLTRLHQLYYYSTLIRSFFTPLIIIFVIYLFIRPYISYFKSRSYRAPGPIPLPFIGYLSILIGDVAENNFRLSKKYGDICEIEMFGYRYVLISNPSLLKDLFSPSVNSAFLRRMPLMPGFKELGMDKEGLLLNLDIPKWRHNRKFFQQSLSPPSFVELSTKYTRECCGEMMEYWNDIEQDTVVRLDHWYRAFTSDMMGLVAAGNKEDSLKVLHRKVVMKESSSRRETDEKYQPSKGEIYRRLREDYAEALNFFVFVPKFVWNLPFIKEKCKHYRETLNSLTEFEIDFIKERKEIIKAESNKRKRSADSSKELVGFNRTLISGNNSKVRPDFLTMLLTTNEDDDPTPDDIKQNLREMFSAGTGTTTTTLCAITYLLAKHPEIERRMVEEILSVVGPDREVEPLDLPKLEYTEAVLNESVRLYPVVPVTYRFTSDQSTEISGYNFPPNTLFAINLGHIHRDARYFKEPEKFNPDRFMGNWREKLPQYAFSPFGHGMRSCPGKNFSITEIKVILATIYRKYTFRLVNSKEPLHLKFAAVNDITKMEVFVEKRDGVN
ncbi:16570_t:CDS:1 [Acaulospora morrowiae]|uniref:16570_t:CDS:1 n=1 Tax=Acaulospora morrowiae TaxID=94023 RepID=A0A9N9HNN6_9GLOM|nr:16570_t:CDS:1 [Acaulospora morrowiae]